MANIAGSWLIIVKGFLGLKIKNQVLYLQNQLPDELNSLKIRLTFLNCLIEIMATKKFLKIKLLRGEKIKLNIKNKKITLVQKTNEYYVFYNSFE
ncbi:hypothetical protein EQ827_08235 [Lactobacillus bombi]|nr:hypothetical protein [Bombilactobacillus bombi]